jgi:hypothetical protein
VLIWSRSRGPGDGSMIGAAEAGAGAGAEPQPRPRSGPGKKLVAATVLAAGPLWFAAQWFGQTSRSVSPPSRLLPPPRSPARRAITAPGPSTAPRNVRQGSRAGHEPPSLRVLLVVQQPEPEALVQTLDGSGGGGLLSLRRGDRFLEFTVVAVDSKGLTISAPGRGSHFYPAGTAIGQPPAAVPAQNAPIAFPPAVPTIPPQPTSPRPKRREARSAPVNRAASHRLPDPGRRRGAALVRSTRRAVSFAAGLGWACVRRCRLSGRGDIGISNPPGSATGYVERERPPTDSSARPSAHSADARGAA